MEWRYLLNIKNSKEELTSRSIMHRNLLHEEYEVNNVVQYPKDEEQTSVTGDKIDKRYSNPVQLVDQNLKDCNDKKDYDFVPAIQPQKY